MNINTHFSSASQLSSAKCNGGIACNKPDSIWISVFFDGTGNNIEVDEALGRMTNVAKLHKSAKELVNSGVYRIYINGVGTRSGDQGPIDYIRDSVYIGGASGAGGQARILYAKSKAADFLKDQNHAKTINIALFGFSRGAALARHFANVLVNEGLENQNDPGNPFKVGEHINIKFLGIFDTVGSFGLGGNNIDWGFEFEIPQAVEKTVHFIAAHERRSKFDLQSIRTSGCIPVSGRLKEVVYPGMHADVGGGYMQHEQGRHKELSRIPLHNMSQAAINAGVPLYSVEELKLSNPELYSVFEVSSELKRFYKSYCGQIPSTPNLYQSIAYHEALYFKWLKKLVAQPDEFTLLINKAKAHRKNLQDSIEPISKDEREKRVQIIKDLRDAQRRAPRKLTGVQLRLGVYDDPAYLEIHRELQGKQDEIESINNSIDDMEDAYAQLSESYYSAKWRDLYFKGVTPRFSPPASAFYHLSGAKGQMNEQRRVKSITREERDFLTWMDAPVSLPKEASLLFEKYIHDSVAHTPDPTGDRYFQRRAIFFQNDERWVSEKRA
ncbi:T6SS phospholipase effector Tle1-like catalytic domain-containing protein [Alkalimarinus coralli]|uniref:T6SS phospholipase effector Tle1-like catalytic domain-containing protein n=1 Tax=Alkalimarinus coralli TaxID=2935863 RepID=UPI00202B1186|nr:DUF2235 domain-containing protein [Alkalimarinus coralli]